MSNNELVKIKKLGNKFFIFNAKDVEKLRCKHRIVGALDGTLTQAPLQNNYMGLPLVLLPEEVDLLLKKGFATLTDPSQRIDLTENQKIRATIFDYFWTKGYYITSGIKFGGDFLLYPNDPLVIHSQYIVHVVQDEENENVSPVDIVRMGRVATSTKKIAILASPAIKLAIQWAGF
ncbi:tRNA intron endonuclease [Mycotypha africana]|uniref:tRNA intron endonuclease n=1 Tax=Mycotypha africana TaxID=64632 RepID=UPI00230197B4|nr:tRNA intron endonuclease [Mycotypha africana]KAI8979763.1 tRNA intron endonuclease [Mycotypha africana]